MTDAPLTDAAGRPVGGAAVTLIDTAGEVVANGDGPGTIRDQDTKQMLDDTSTYWCTR